MSTSAFVFCSRLARPWMARLRRVLGALFLVWASYGASARLVLVGETVHRASVTPGGAIRGTITVINRGTETAQVRIYQTDYHFRASGESDFPNPATSPRSNAAWLVLDVNELTLAPNGTADVSYRGTVPTDAGLQGTYWSLIMVEQTERIVPQPKEERAGERQAAIRTVVRHAVQIVSDLGAPDAPSLKVLKRFLDSDSRRSFFALDVENAGRWMVRPEVSLELFNSAGVSVAKVEAPKARLYPTCSFRYRFDLAGIASGKYTALAVLDTGDANVSAAQYTLDVP